MAFLGQLKAILLLATPREAIFMEDNAKLKAVIYTRVSSVKQLEGDSLKTQQTDCKKYAESIDATVVKIFVEEAESAKTADRPVLNEMLDYVQENKGKVDILIAWKVDRISRSIEDYFNLRRKLSDYGVRVCSATEPINNSDAMSQALEGIFSVLAQLENNIKSERTLSNMKSGFESGRWQWRARLGYLNSKGPKGTNIPVRDPATFEIIQKGLKAFSSGLFTVTELVAMYESWGLLSPKTHKPFKLNSISRILRDSFYCGKMYSRKWNRISQGLHEPMITEEEYYKNLSILDGKSSALYVSHDAKNELFPLRGDLKCAECGKPLTASKSRGENGNKYGYYHCYNKQCSLCYKSKDLKSEDINIGFYEYLHEIRPNDDTLNLFKAILLDEWQGEVDSLKAVITNIENQLKECNSERAKIFEVAKTGAFSADYIKTQTDKIDNREITLKTQISEVKIEEYDIETVINEGINFMKNPAATWKKSLIDTKQRIQKMVFPEGFYFDTNTGFGTPRLSSPFAFCEVLASSENQLVTPRRIELRLPG